ncbi:MAG: sterol desaturase family protein [Acidimicrobiia bacterium]|nr:sterol desaturase family protein [Acidimicrobiia bacterium]
MSTVHPSRPSRTEVRQPPPPSPWQQPSAWPPPAPPSSSRTSAARPRRRIRGRLAAAALIAVSLLIDAEALFIIPFVFVLVVPFEKLFPRHRQPLRRPALSTDLGYALAGGLLNIVGLIIAIPFAVLSLAWIPGLLLRPLVTQIPPPVLPLVGVALFDLAIYWTHRWYHEVPVLWRFHAIHHSAERLDWVSGFRNHPLDGTLIAPAFVFLLAAGFPAEFTGVLAVVQIALGLFLHANVRWRLRPLHKIVITPEFHHWHHANESGAINSNYSVFLPAWDLLFGTYFMPPDRRPRRYGVSEYIPDGMIGQLRHPFRGLPPIRLLLGGVIRHPVRSAKDGCGLLRRHVLVPIRSVGLGRRPLAPSDHG